MIIQSEVSVDCLQLSSDFSFGMTIGATKGRGCNAAINNCDQSDLIKLETIQKNESTTYLQPTFAPKMMDVSKFLDPFDESSLTNEEAAQKYSTYVAGFLKDQLSDQFDRHKNSAWLVSFIFKLAITNYFRFRDKYHPDYAVPKEKEREVLISRFETYKKMRDEGFFDGLSLEYKERARIAKVLDQC